MNSIIIRVWEEVLKLEDRVSRSVLALSIGALVVGYFVVLLPVYNITLHPLRKYPGPKLWAASSLPWGFAFLSGNWHHTVMGLHARYGHVVRIAPNELSYDIPDAWEDIYGYGTTRKENPKPTWYLDPKHHEMVGAKEKDHKRMRRLLANGFTGAAMREQEPMIRKNVDLLIERLHEVTEEGKIQIDMFEWFSYCTFDIIGDLSFGESFGCLGNSMVRTWLGMVFANVKLLHNLVLCKRIPLFFFFLPVSETYKLWRGSGEFDKTVRDLIERRLDRKSERQDFVEIMNSKKGNSYMTPTELYKNSAFLTLAGSETTSTVMAVVVYMIGTHPDVKAKLRKELLANLNSEDEINMRSATNLPYLMAVIEESMRCHPPGPNALWRITPQGGNRILGDWLPENTVLGIPHRVMYRSEHNFRRAHEFLPERWMQNGKDSEFVDDRRDSFHPFSYGPRQCLAVNLAYAEMRYILARMLWSFDFRIAEESRNWSEALHSWLIWEKRPLKVYLEPWK